MVQIFEDIQFHFYKGKSGAFVYGRVIHLFINETKSEVVQLQEVMHYLTRIFNGQE